MAKAVVIQDRIDVQAILQTSVAPQQGFGKNVFIIDADEIPTDRRVVEVTKSDYATTLDSSGLPYAYAQTHFSQKRTPDSLLIGRWAKAAAATYLNLGGSYTQTLATWTAISDGEFTVYETATPTNLDDITAIDFSGMTALSQLPAVLNAKLAALVGPTITGLDSAEFSFDVFGRLVLTMPGTGASAITVNIKPLAAGAGTDVAALMDYTEAVPVAGLDAETITEAIDAIEAKDNSGYFITAKFDDVKATKEAEITLFCAKIEAMEKLGVFLTDDVLCKDSGDTTNIIYAMNALSYKRTMGIYYESIALRPTIFPDSAGLGAVIPATEGTTKFCQEALVGVGTSGYASPLSKAESDAVNGHGGVVVETVGGSTYWFNGLTVGGEEMRIMMGRDWFVTRIREDIFNYTIQQPLTAFDNETLTAIAGFIQNRGEQAILRRILVDTVARPFTVNMPDEDAFTQAERASHTLTATDVFQAYLNSAVNEYQIIGTWTI
jgi:hypothetical protein